MAKLISEDTAKTLLDKLSSDDKFREQLLGDPVAALASVGVDVEPHEVPPLRALPTKEDVAANADALKVRLSGKAGMGILLL